MKNQILKIVGGIAAGVIVSAISNEIAKRQYGKPLVDKSRLRAMGDGITNKVKSLAA